MRSKRWRDQRENYFYRYKEKTTLERAFIYLPTLNFREKERESENNFYFFILFTRQKKNWCSVSQYLYWLDDVTKCTLLCPRRFQPSAAGELFAFALLESWLIKCCYTSSERKIVCPSSWLNKYFLRAMSSSTSLYSTNTSSRPNLLFASSSQFLI